MLITVILVTTIAGSEPNHCNDSVANEQWQQLTDRYPDDLDLASLVGYRRHLCDQVARGRLTVTEATQRFEDARQRLLNIWDEQNRNEDTKRNAQSGL